MAVSSTEGTIFDTAKPWVRTAHSDEFMQERPDPPRPADQKVKIEGREFKIPAGAKIVKVPASMAGKQMEPVNLQVGPTQPTAGHPGFVFAVFAHNPAYHEVSREDWQRVAWNAIERWVSQEGHNLESAMHHEPTRPFNLVGEYR